MKYYVQQNDNCCVLTCFAMLLDVLPKKLVNYIGEDGSAELAEGIYRGHHMMELIDLSIRKFSVHPFIIERFPVHVYENCTLEFDEIDLIWYLKRYNGIIFYRNHCGVWEYSQVKIKDLMEHKVYNPRGQKIPLESIWEDIEVFIGFP